MSHKVMGTPEELVTRMRAAKILGVTVDTLGLWVRKGLLTPITKGRKRFFYRTDVVALLQVFSNGTDLPSVAAMAMRALIRVEQCEKKIDELHDMFGVFRVPLETDTKSILDLMAQAERFSIPDVPAVHPAEVFSFAKKMLTTTEEYFRLVRMVTFQEEPWRVYLDACTNMLATVPQSYLQADQELRSAYGYLATASRHLHNVAYFYTRTTRGVKAANEAFLGDGAFAPVISMIFPH